MTRAEPPVELSPDRVEAQLRRAHRWELPRTALAYPHPPPKSEFAIDLQRAPRTRPRRWIQAGLGSLACNASLLALMAMLPGPQPKLGPADDEALRIVMAEPRRAEPLQSLPIDIATPLGQERQWTHFDQPVSRPSRQLAPLAVPSVIDRFAGNPLSVSPTAGGDVVVGGLAGRATRGRQVEGAEFLGVRARGDRFVFVLDNTLDTFGESWTQTKRETLAAISRLEPGQQFAVVMIDGTSYRDGFREGLHPARADSAARLAPWLEAQVLIDQGLPEQAMKTAVDLRPDAIYLVGSAGFTPESVEPLRAANKIVDHDQIKMPGVVVHTIGISQLPELAEPLRQIAKHSGGHFHHFALEVERP